MRTESHSSITTYKQCPHKYYKRYIEQVKDVPTDALIHGIKTHELISQGKAGTPELDFARKIKGKTRRAKIKVSNQPIRIFDGQPCIELTEQKYALDTLWEPVSFDDETAIFRGVIDYAKIAINREALRLKTIEGGALELNDLITSVELKDWKTGKVRNSKRQLTWYSLFFFSEYPNLMEVRCQNIFVTAQVEATPWVVYRKSVPTIQTEIEENLTAIRKEGLWAPRPSPLCSWCPYEEPCKAETNWNQSGVGPELVARGLPDFLNVKTNVVNVNV